MDKKYKWEWVEMEGMPHYMTNRILRVRCQQSYAMLEQLYYGQWHSLLAIMYHAGNFAPAVKRCQEYAEFLFTR